MDFGDIPTAAAQGGILAHSVSLAGGRLRKGKVLSCDDLALLRSEGITRITVARPEPGDIGEDAAALRIAQALVPGPGLAGLRLSPVGTGRVNLHAVGPGIVRIDAARIAALNAVDPMITVATLTPLRRVDAGEMVATVKIISYAVSDTVVTKAEAAGQGAIAVVSPIMTRAAYIETRIGAAEAVGDKGWRVTKDRLDRLAVTLDPVVTVAHTVPDLARAISAAAPAPLILILTASATSDPRDVGPQALRQAGGDMIRFGMPVDPGNLLFLGRLGPSWVIGLPGCAKSPALNGADWVMERVICGLPPNAADIAALGVGGLLKEIPTRPRPRQG